MDQDSIPYLLKTLGQAVENRVADAMRGRDEKDDSNKRERESDPLPRMRSENGMDYMEPDWDELDKKANLIVARYTAISFASNILPWGLDVAAVGAIFMKMTVELAGVYQVIVTTKRARQMGSAIATTTGTVLGAVYAGSRLVKFIPGGYFVGVAVQAPIVTAVAWAGGDALKGYFKETRKGREPGLDALRDSYGRTLRLHLRKAKVKPAAADDAAVVVTGKAATVATAALPAGTGDQASAPPGKMTTGEIVEKIAGLHELLRAGAITQADFDRKKTELLSRM